MVLFIKYLVNSNSPMKYVLSVLYRWGNRDTELFSDLPHSQEAEETD